MRSTLRQRVGSGIAVLGLGVLATAGAFVVAAPANAEERTSPVCNNIHDGEDPASCHSGGPYGEVDWDVTEAGLVLHVTAASGTSWSGIRVCAPYSAPTQPADCQPADQGLLSPTSVYSVQLIAPVGATGGSEDGKTYEFEPCASEFVVTVPASALPQNSSDWWWAMHLITGGCQGSGTHEAFGRVVTSTTPPGEEPPGGENPPGEEPPSGENPPGEEPPGGNETPSDQPPVVEGVTITNEPTTTTTSSVSGERTGTPGSDVLSETFVEAPSTAAQPQVIATLPRTGTGTSGLLALAGLALMLGGVAIRFGQPGIAR